MDETVMSNLKIKELVRQRDGMKCVECGMTNEEHIELYGVSLDVHRKVPGSAYSLDGCEAVCKKCHMTSPERHGAKAEMKQVPVRFEKWLLEYLRDVAWWTRMSIQDIIEAGTRAEVERLEKENKGKFEARKGQIKPGRRVE